MKFETIGSKKFPKSPQTLITVASQVAPIEFNTGNTFKFLVRESTTYSETSFN